MNKREKHLRLAKRAAISNYLMALAAAKAWGTTMPQVPQERVRMRPTALQQELVREAQEKRERKRRRSGGAAT